ASLGERVAKWRRRHPRLASLTSVILLAAGVVGTLAALLYMHNERLRGFEATEALRTFDTDLTAVQFLAVTQACDHQEVDELLTRGRQALDRYQIVGNPAWRERTDVRYLAPAKQEELEKDVRVMLLLVARATALQAADLPRGKKRDEGIRLALRLNETAESCGAGEHLPR